MVCVSFYFADKTLIVWKLTRDETNYGIPQKRLYGHSHFISDVVLSSDGNYALSGSWDKTLRLWDLAAGKTTRRFKDHTKVCWSLNWFERRIVETMQSCCSRSIVVTKKNTRKHAWIYCWVRRHNRHSDKLAFEPFDGVAFSIYPLDWVLRIVLASKLVCKSLAPMSE